MRKVEAFLLYIILIDETDFRKGGREMAEKRLTVLSSISLVVILFAGLLFLVSWLLCLALPEIVVRILGIALLISIPVFVFINVRQIQKA